MFKKIIHWLIGQPKPNNAFIRNLPEPELIYTESQGFERPRRGFGAVDKIDAANREWFRKAAGG